MKWDVVFWDDVSGPATPSCEAGPMGGSPYGLLILARGLAASGLRVLVCNQGDREEVECDGRLVFRSVASESGLHTEVGALVIHRSSSVPPIKARRTFVLATDVPDSSYDHLAPLLCERDGTLLCVSEWQKSIMPRVPRKVTLPPPLLDSTYDRPIPAKDARKFVYASALMKGWDATLAAWRAMKKQYPKTATAELHVCSGWGQPLVSTPYDDVVPMGLVKPSDQVAVFDDAAGLFFVNTYPETFCAIAAIAEARGCRMHVLAPNGAGALPTTMAQPVAGSISELLGVFAEHYGEATTLDAHNDFRMSTLVPKYRALLLDGAGIPEVSTGPRKPATVCLTMIAKNEGKVIRRCLESVRPFIDSWCIIVDPLTTDDTREVILDALAGIPGEVHEPAWEGFDGTRTRGIRLAEAYGTDYLLTIDADDVLEGALDKTKLGTDDIYVMRVHDATVTYDRPQVFRADGTFRYDGVAHEALVSDVPNRSASLLSSVVYRRLESTRQGTAKHERDVAVLTEALRKDPSNTRYTYYLAQSYADLGKTKKAIEFYKKRAAMSGGYDEEAYVSLYRVGRLLMDAKAHRNEVEAAMLKAWEYRPQRVEALCHLANYLTEHGAHARAYLYAKTAAGAPRPADRVLVEDMWHTWGARYLLAVSAIRLGKLREARALIEALLRDGTLPPEEAEGARGNLKTCVDHAREEPAPDRGWSPESAFASSALDVRHSTYFGEFATLLKGAVSAGGSELGLGLTLFALATSIRAASIVEIGRFKGFSTLALASALRFCAEGWEEQPGAKQRPDVDYVKHESRTRDRLLVSIDPYPLPEADELLKQAGVRDRVLFVDKRSSEVGFGDRKIDLLFIDGDHTYEGCRGDADRFIPNVRENGFVVLHDAFGWWREDGSNGSPIKRVADELREDPALEAVLVDTGYMSFYVFRKRCARHDARISPALGEVDSGGLTKLQRLAWGPRPEVAARVEAMIEPGWKVLEIGPGPIPFCKATHFVDRPGEAVRPNTTYVDVTRDPLPFEDKSFDFVYCRHVVEDLFNPFPVLKEIERVGKAGYVETPSPLAELTRGVDGGRPLHRGYIHHRWFVWVEGDALCFAEKCPVIEHYDVDFRQQIETTPGLCNTYFVWKDSLPVRHLQHDFEFRLHVDYHEVLGRAVDLAVKDWRETWSNPIA